MQSKTVHVYSMYMHAQAEILIKNLKRASTKSYVPGKEMVEGGSLGVEEVGVKK